MVQQGRVHKPGRMHDDQGRTQNLKKPAGRKRAVLACEECRTRKRRCNGLLPCEGCSQRLTECNYSSDIETQRWHQSMIHVLRARLEELEHSKNQSQGLHRRRSQVDPPADAMTEPVSHSSLISDKTSTTISVDGEMSSETPPLPTVPPEVSRIPEQVEGEARQEPLGDVSVSVPGNVNGLATPAPREDLDSIHHFPPSRCIQPSNFERMMMPISLAMGKIDGLASDTSILPMSTSSRAVLLPSTRTDCTCDESLRAMRCQLPLRRYSDVLVGRYFSRHNRILPIIHQPTFLTQYERLWDSGFSSHSGARRCSKLCTQKGKGKVFPTMVYLILALGSLFSSQSLEENATRAEGFYRTAQEINFIEMMDDEVGIELIQVGLLMSAYLQSTERYSKCWNVTGLTIRMAQNMGLHLTVPEALKKGLLAPESDPLEVEMRTLVWYGCILLDTDIALLFGQPCMIPVRAEFSQPPFELVHFYTASQVENHADVRVPDTEVTSHLLGYYLQKIKLYDILRQVVQRDSSMTITPTSLPADIDTGIREVFRLDTKVVDWQDGLPTYLKHPKLRDRASPLAPGTGPEQLEELDVSALSERLYNRFLHVRQLVLRPALEMLFKQGQEEQNNNKSIEAKLRAAALWDIASQCVRSAADMIEFLGSGIEAESFSCWWYNINMLYSSGTTLLMGQYCRLDGPDHQSIADKWNHCLECLSRYYSLSSIAEKSSKVLREYFKRLVAQSHDEIRSQQIKDGVLVTDFQAAPLTEYQGLDVSLEQPVAGGFPVDVSTNDEDPISSFLDENPHVDQLSMLLPDSYLFDASSWPELPFLPQFEDLPSSDLTWRTY